MNPVFIKLMFVYDQDIDIMFTLIYYTDNLKRYIIQNSITKQTKNNSDRLRYYDNKT